VVSREQLRALGMSDAAIDRAVKASRLHRVFRGVFAVGRRGTGERGRLRAATLACGPSAVISHRSAAALLGVLNDGPAVIDVIATGDRGRRIDGIRFHRVRLPRADEVGTVAGIPCTSPARTLVDLAGVVGDWTLRSAFERAAQRRILDVPAIEASMDPGRVGVRSLRKLVDEWRRAAPVAKKGRLKSPLEAKVLPLILRRGIPAPLLNAPVKLAKGRIEVDFLWPEQRFVVEADSRDFHGTAVAFERDRWRDRELMRAGYSTLRVTHQQAESETKAIADTIASRIYPAAASRN
jgi:very-short-patch-repair endonuclease